MREAKHSSRSSGKERMRQLGEVGYTTERIGGSWKGAVRI